MESGQFQGMIYNGNVRRKYKDRTGLNVVEHVWQMIPVKSP